MTLRAALLPLCLALAACGGQVPETHIPATRSAGLDTLAFQALREDEARPPAQGQAGLHYHRASVSERRGQSVGPRADHAFVDNRGAGTKKIGKSKQSPDLRHILCVSSSQ